MSKIKISNSGIYVKTQDAIKNKQLRANLKKLFDSNLNKRLEKGKPENIVKK